MTAIFLVSPYTLNYDFAILAWVLALLRQRGDVTPREHGLILTVWTLPVTMMIVSLAHVPFGFMVLATFAAWLLRRLAKADVPVASEHGLSLGWRVQPALLRPRA